jgi:hypothetical protein
MQHGMRADMRRIATRQEQIVLRVKVMEELATQTQPVSGKTNAQKKRSTKGSPCNPFALRITITAPKAGASDQYNTFFATG